MAMTKRAREGEGKREMERVMQTKGRSHMSKTPKPHTNALTFRAWLLPPPPLPLRPPPPLTDPHPHRSTWQNNIIRLDQIGGRLWPSGQAKHIPNMLKSTKCCNLGWNRDHAGRRKFTWTLLVVHGAGRKDVRSSLTLACSEGTQTGQAKNSKHRRGQSTCCSRFEHG